MAWPACASFFKKRTMLKADCESRPEVGSSKNRRRFGFAANSTPIVTPEELELAYTSIHSTQAGDGTYVSSVQHPNSEQAHLAYRSIPKDQ